MSVAVEELKVQRVIDPRTDANAPGNRMYNVFEGAADIGYQNLSQDGGVSNTQLTFTLNPPSPRVFVDRRVMLSLTFQLNFSGTSAGVGQTLLQAAGLPTAVGVSGGTAFYDAPRAYPLAKAIQTIQFSLGNDRLGQNLGVYWYGLNRYSVDRETQDLWHSMTPTSLDQSLTYEQLAGFHRDPLRGYGDFGSNEVCGRGGFIGAEIMSNSALGTSSDTAVVQLYVTEMVDLSPFLFEKGRNDVGFIGVQNQSMTIMLGGKGTSALSGLAASLWSHSNNVGAGTLSGISVNVLNAQVRVSYLTPDPIMEIPRSLNYSYFEITYYPTTFSTPVTSGSQVVITQNNIQLQSIPSRILFWVAPQDASYTVNSTDTAYSINNLNLSFDNRDSLLSNASQEQLYQICVKNKTNSSWRQFTNDVGSFIALDFGEDIPLRATQAPGLRGTFNLRLTVTAQNNAPTSSIPTLSLVVIAEGVLSIIDQNVIRNIGVLSPQDVLNSKQMPGKAYQSSGSVYGGASFWEKLLSGIKSVGRPLLNVARAIAPAIAPQYALPLEVASNAAQALGVGRGGRRLTRAQLQKMLK